MTKYATMNPRGSTSPYDLFDNSQNFDTAINSITAAIWQDRFGKSRHTWYGLEEMAKAAIAAFGYITMDSFQAGATLTLPNQVLRDTSTGEYYRWDGVFPKVVPAGSTPASSGGVSIGAWLSVGDAVLRGQISDPDGAVKYPELQMARWRDEGDIRGWGAKGDSDSTGATGTDDTAAIQAAMDSGRKMIKIPANHYFRVSQTLIQPSGLTIVGEDRFSSCIIADPGMDGLLDVMQNRAYNSSTLTTDTAVGLSTFRIHANGFSRVKSDPALEWGRCYRSGSVKGFRAYHVVFQEGPQHCLDLACWKDNYIGKGHAGVPQGMTEDAVIINCELIDYCYDDGLTTHGVNGVTIADCTSRISDFAKSQHTYVITQNGFEIDDGSYNVTVNDCRAYCNNTNSKGFATANHPGNPISYNVVLEKCDTYEGVSGVTILGALNGDTTFGTDSWLGRNYSINNCGLIYPHVATDNAQFPSRAFDVQYGMDIVVRNLRVQMRGVNGEAARSPCAVINLAGAINIDIDGVRIEGVGDGQMGTIFATGSSWFRITNADSSNIRIRNVTVDNIGWADRIIRDVDKSPGGALSLVDCIRLGRNSTDGRTKTGVMSGAFCQFNNVVVPTGVQSLRIGRTLTDRSAFGYRVGVNYDSVQTIMGGLKLYSETASDGIQPVPGILFDRQFTSSLNQNGKGCIASRTSAAAPGAFSLTAYDEDTGRYEPMLVVVWTAASPIKKYIAPVVDGDMNNGNAGTRWLNVHSVNGVITTSDADDKDLLRDAEEKENSAFAKIARLPSVWKWIRRVEEEGANARWHSGPTVQAAIAIMEECGLNWSEYSCFCYDYQPYVPERIETVPALIDDETGEIMSPEHEVLIPEIKESAGYGFRKEELLWWCMRALVAQHDNLEERVARLESQ